MRWLWIVVLLLGASACDEDGGSASPPVPRWEEISLDTVLERAAIFSLRASPTRTLAVGTASSGPFVLERSNSDWALTYLDGNASVFAFDAGFALDGRAVVVGGAVSGGVRVWAERPDFTPVDLTRSGTLRSVARDNEGDFVATGSGTTSIPLARGSIDGAWVATTVPTPGDPQEKALERIVSHPDGLFAVGWDDGGEGTAEMPHALFLHSSGAAWDLVALPCGGCSNVELKALTVLPSGTLVLGGARTEWSAPHAEDRSVATLSFYDPSTLAWTAIVLPEASALDRVNDVVRTSEGSLVLACGRDGGAALAFLPAGGGGSVEWRADEASLYAVVEAHDGSVLAGGFREDGEALLLRRWSTP